MPWTIFAIPNDHRAELDAALKDDLVSRQSHTVRDGGSVGGASGTTVVLVEGGAEAVKRAEELLAPAGTKMVGADAERLYRRLQDEQDAASAGMGLFFTEE